MPKTLEASVPNLSLKEGQEDQCIYLISMNQHPESNIDGAHFKASIEMLAKYYSRPIILMGGTLQVHNRQLENHLRFQTEEMDQTNVLLELIEQEQTLVAKIRQYVEEAYPETCWEVMGWNDVTNNSDYLVKKQSVDQMLSELSTDAYSKAYKKAMDLSIQEYLYRGKRSEYSLDVKTKLENAGMNFLADESAGLNIEKFYNVSCIFYPGVQTAVLKLARDFLLPEQYKTENKLIWHRLNFTRQKHLSTLPEKLSRKMTDAQSEATTSSTSQKFKNLEFSGIQVMALAALAGYYASRAGASIEEVLAKIEAIPSNTPPHL